MGDAVRLDARLGAMDEARPYRRVEVITGHRQRRAWTAQEKERIVAESAVAGANISEVARRHGVNRGLLTVWRRQAGIVPEDTAAEANAPLFIPVTVAEDTPRAEGVKGRHPAAAELSAGRIELDLRAGRLVFCGPVDPALAAAVIAATRRRE